MSRIVSVSEAAALALHAMAYLADQNRRPVPVAEMADALSASANHLSKVLQRLAKGGLVRSIRGPAGGFVLAKPAGEVSLLAVYEEIEGELQSGACLFDMPVCDGRTCVLGGVLANAVEQIHAHLARTTLADVQAATRGCELLSAPATADETAPGNGL